mmetsp:Transcript_18041/g.30336  ORF Transcript_18041/g.30336 Transcript_18041/m.30336 type:complete len:203 (+) Transcript_18041:1591-2199(+)
MEEPPAAAGSGPVLIHQVSGRRGGADRHSHHRHDVLCAVPVHALWLGLQCLRHAQAAALLRDGVLHWLHLPGLPSPPSLPNGPRADGGGRGLLLHLLAGVQVLAVQARRGDGLHQPRQGEPDHRQGRGGRHGGADGEGNWQLLAAGAAVVLRGLSVQLCAGAGGGVLLHPAQVDQSGVLAGHTARGRRVQGGRARLQRHHGR